ncbi:hypothetical protein [Streptomyces sp. TS71-3]|uniref:hypothetical protein n=1 Tax=Streptomyces sp. TS71-3 TaxID=2733862 RepID=UPI001B2C699D|nr:hypothetical protein [Streptomyces sp. TS71-3]GHJ39842.1 hypothetical protein Sm713_54510 [Streptomyces sp. TS71-3]
MVALHGALLATMTFVSGAPDPPDPSPPDPDDLLGTVVSLSGGVAAILGGFVLAALLTLSSERNSTVELLRERRRVTADLRTRLQQQTQANETALKRLLYSWLRLSHRLDDEPPGAAEAVRQLASLGTELTDAQLRELSDDFRRAWTAADDVVTGTARALARDPELRSFSRWSARTAVPAGTDGDLLRDAFDRAVASVERRENLKSRPAATTEARARQDRARQAEEAAAAERRIRNWATDRAVQAAGEVRDELARARTSEQQTATELTTWRLPSHLGYGIVLFCFIVATGVIYPLLLMPTTPEAFSEASEFWVKMSVGGQCLATGLYLTLLALSVRRTARSDVPAP